MAMLAMLPPAIAQTSPTQTPHKTIPEAATPGGSGSTSEPLSDKLDKSGGVIHPPANADPGLAQAPPSAGRDSMPVIPPPGTPGGKPGVNPK
jgi:hypothetical protein